MRRVAHCSLFVCLSALAFACGGSGVPPGTELFAPNFGPIPTPVSADPYERLRAAM